MTNYIMVDNNGYIRSYMPGHHRAMNDGVVYEHILVAESMLGRELMDSEVVHHLDLCRSNNNPSNLIVFKTMSDHTRFHMTGVMEPTGDGTYISPESEFRNGYDICPICGGKKTRRANTCQSCRERSNPSRKPPMDTLDELLKTHNKSEIGRMYGVSTTAVRKWIKSYQL